MGKTIPVDAYFKPKNNIDLEGGSSVPNSNVGVPVLSNSHVDPPVSEIRPTKTRRIEINKVDISSLERDPGLHLRIWDYNANQLDEIRRAYIKAGPFQPLLSHYPKSGPVDHPRSFQSSWFDLFPSRLEYSPTNVCLSCYLFSEPSGNSGNKEFIVGGFRKWKRVKDGKHCAFLIHVGKGGNSYHNVNHKKCADLMNQPQHIHRIVEKYTSEKTEKNRLRVKTSIQAARYLATHSISFRGRDESHNSLNRGNFLNLIGLMGDLNEKIKEVVLSNAPQNAIYTSPKIQKEILHVFASRVKKAIGDEIGVAKYTIIVDEARDESKREQMSIVLRFVDKDVFVRERLFGLVHVSNTAAKTLKKEICSVLSNHTLDIQNIRGQGYDGARNMRGEWNGLKALFLNECPYAYYVHCFAHRLQLALVTASKEVFPIFHFYGKLTSVVNVVGASCKRNDELKAAKAAEIEYLVSIDELETGRGLNQIGTLQRAGDTRWSSHLRSISSMIKMFSATCEVLLKISEDEASLNDRGLPDAAHDSITTFEFVFILHLMKEILEITDMLCQAFQRKSQDILNVIRLVSSTKNLFQKLRDNGLDDLLTNVKSFCALRSIDVPDMSARYVPRKGRACHHQDEYTIEHYYRVDIFYAAIDSQLQELNCRFNDHSMELLTLGSVLDPIEYESFRIDDVLRLVEKFYPQDSTDQERMQLKTQLLHYEQNVVGDRDYKTLSTISGLCRWLVETRRSTTYHLVYRVIVLVLTLPVSTATTERSFSAMKLIKTRLSNKMEDDFLSESTLLFIENEIVMGFSLDSILNDFWDLRERRVAL